MAGNQAGENVALGTIPRLVDDLVRDLGKPQVGFFCMSLLSAFKRANA